jgi:cytochrome o ubiquinol oxidase subunit III
MSATETLPRTHVRESDPYRLGRDRSGAGPGRSGVGRDGSTGHGEGGPASKSVIVGYGFWIFLLSDIVMFSAFFAAHAVLQTATAGGPSGRDLFDPQSIVIETACLLLSSFTCGLSAVAAGTRRQLQTQFWLLITGVLGLAFLVFEARDFATMIAAGAGPQRSAFLSSFFSVVGLHGLHVSAGLLWLGTMMAQVFVKGFRADTMRRLLCFNLFWHVLDIIWVALFTVVYLMGEGL